MKVKILKSFEKVLVAIQKKRKVLKRDLQVRLGQLDNLFLPLIYQVPPRITVRVGAGSCPAISKSQMKVGISSLQ